MSRGCILYHPNKSLSIIILAISLSLSLAVIAIIPMYHEASAKECTNSDNGQNNGDNSASDSSSCSDKQDSSSSNKHSVTEEDKTPFVLATPVPFP